MAFRIILFFVLLAQNVVAVQTYPELPLPFCYFENLYFDVGTSTFLSDNLSLKKAIDLGEKRGYFLKNLEKPLNDPKPVLGTTFFLFESNRTENYLGHFFHLLEHICALWSFYGDRHFQDVGLIVLAANGNLENQHEWEGPNEINKHLLRALFPLAEVKTWREFLDGCDRARTLCFERALTSDRALTFSSPECMCINKMLGVAYRFIAPEALQRLADRVHAYAKVSREDDKILRVAYLKRQLPRALDSKLEESLLTSIRSSGPLSLRVEDFATKSFREQVAIIANTDLLISVHGNGLSHILFLPPHARIIEIFPPSAHSLDYRLFADIRGLDYTGIIPDRGVVEKEESYWIGAFGNFNTSIDWLDINPILSRMQK